MTPRYVKDPEDHTWAKVGKDILGWWLSKSGNAPIEIGNAFKVSLMSSLLALTVDMYDQQRSLIRPNLETGERTEQRIWERTLDLQTINPENLYIDATGRGRFIIWEEFVDKTDLTSLDPNDGWINLDAIEEEVGADESSDSNTTNASGQGRSEVKVTHFYGDLWGSDDGTLIGTSIRAIIVNHKTVIRQVEDNPYWDGEPPIVVEPFIEVPFSVWHIPFLLPSLPISNTIQEILNLVIDSTMLASLPMLSIDDATIDSEENAYEVHPMKIWKRRGGLDPKNPGVVPVQFPGANPSVIQVAFMLDRIYSEVTAMTEFEAGLPSRRTRTTAEERGMALQMSSAFTSDLMHGAENRFVKKVLQKAWMRILQFQPDVPQELMPKIDDIMGEKKGELWKEHLRENYHRMALDYEFEVGGISKYIEKMQRAEVLMGVLKIIGRSEPLMQQIDMNSLLMELFNTLDVDVKLQEGVAPGATAPSVSPADQMLGEG
jgi:hypothetical protein